VKRIDDGRPVILLDEAFARWHWPRGYVENVAAAIALGVEDDRAVGRVYNVCDSDAYTKLEWIRRIGAVVGWEGEVLTVPNEALLLSLWVSLDFDQDYTVDSSRIRRELGYRELVPEDEALGGTIE
jgi:nucleoside-diphosphate-sugar epimerase